MRAMEINKRDFYYCLFEGKEEIRDINGYATGEYILTYAPPERFRANVSPAAGQSSIEQFGNLDNYDKSIVTDWLDCPISESSVLFIDKEPEFTEIVTYEEDPEAPGTYIEAVRTVPTPDYIVRRVAKSINSVSIAVQKVSTS